MATYAKVDSGHAHSYTIRGSRGGRTCFNFHVTIMRTVECNYQPGELYSDASAFLAKSLLEGLLLDLISQKLLLDQPEV